MITTISILTALAVCVFLFLKHPKFGTRPSGERLMRMKESPNFRDGKFHNLSHTPTLVEGYSYTGVIYINFFKPKPRNVPKDTIPTVKTDLKSLSIHDDILIWFGHSSYYLQIDGKRLLVDPVFSGNASPLPSTVKAFKGTDVYTVDDLPSVDVLFITHDHYDHVDYNTIIALKNKTSQVVCGLGVGAHFESWGFTSDRIIEKDWYDSVNLDFGLRVYFEPTRHFSGRGLSRNNTLWVSFVLESEHHKIYLGGDSGYDSHYADIGNRHGPIDLAILDNGQYNDAWRYIHNHPEDVVKAIKDLKAKRLFPVHSSKFPLSNHPWDEPLIRISELTNKQNIPIITPMIGEIVHLKNKTQVFNQWWRGIS